MSQQSGRRLWGVITPLPASVLAMQAKMLEEAGLEGLFAPQVYGPPFVTLGAAAAVTNRVKLAWHRARLRAEPVRGLRWLQWTSTG